MSTYEAIHPPTMTSPRPKNKDEHVFRCNLFIYFSSMHPVSTAAQSTTITEAPQSKGQKYKQPRTTAAIDVPSISLRFSTDVGSSSRQQQQQHLDHDGREPETKKKERDRGTVGGPQQTGRSKETGL